MNSLLCGLVISYSMYLPDKPIKSVVIETGGSHVCFDVEVADNFWSRARGLMHRNDLDENQGMLFFYQDAAPVTFWMKNVIIPLNILFVSSTGRIEKIIENAAPMSETPMSSDVSVSAVLEINGGASRRALISPGAHLKPELSLSACE